MKKVVLLILLSLVGPFLCRAQKTLEVYYIAHDHYESSLSSILNVVRQNSRYNTDKKVLFYLANIDKPEWFFLSPKDDQDYQKFMGELNGQTSHNVYPDIDRLKLIEILSDKSVTKGIGLGAYQSVVFNYYITPSFAMMEYCDAVIGRLFWDLDMGSIPREKLEINIYHHSDDGYSYDENQLFGRKNLLNGFPVLIDTY